MSDGADAGFLYVRFCRGFVDGFPESRFTKLSDTEFVTAIKKEAEEAVQSRAQEFEEWRAGKQHDMQDAIRQHLESAIARPGSQVVESVSRPRPAKKRTEWDEFVERLSFLGQTVTDPVQGRLASPRIWLADELSAEAAAQAIAALEYTPHSSQKSHQLRAVLCPRYGYVNACEMSMTEQTQCREGMRQFWDEPNASHGSWYRFARQLHPDQGAILHAIGRPNGGPTIAMDSKNGAPMSARKGVRNGSLQYTEEQKQEMRALQESILDGWRDPRLTAEERVQFEMQQIAAYTQILENPIEMPLNERSSDPRAAKVVQFAPERRLSVSLDPPQVTIVSTPGSPPAAIGLTCDEAGCLQCLPLDGHWISGTAITELTLIERPERKFKKIREKSGNDFIESKTGKGHRIRPEWLA